MALVAYDNSDSSDYEEEDNESAPVIILLNNKPDSKHVPGPSVQESVIQNEDSQPQDKGTNLFNFLPQPKNKKPRVIEEDDEFLHKKEVVNAVKPKAKITVPSLSDFKDMENSTPNVKPRSAQKKSDLLSMLPQPRNGVISTKSLIPHVLTKKPAPGKRAALPAPVKKPRVDTTPLINEYSDDSDDEVQNDFFSIHKPVDVPDDIDFTSEQDITQAPDGSKEKRKGIEAFFKKEEVVDHVQLEPDYDSSSMEVQDAASSGYNGYSAEPTPSNEMELDDEAIMKLCGARGKRKREEIQIVNVNQQEVLANAREMLLKGLMDDTTQRVSASKKKGNEPTSQQRRKHQITYLAYQAKANEAELQNQWANNRMSKRQTQAKYGF